MHRIPVESSNIATVGFANRVLEIEFKHGGVYQYFDVPENVFLDLIKADSKGTYHNKYIRGHYQYTKIL